MPPRVKQTFFSSWPKHTPTHEDNAYFFAALFEYVGRVSESAGQPNNASTAEAPVSTPHRRRRRVRVDARSNERSAVVSRADYALLGLLAFCVCGSVLAVGSVHVPVLLAFATLLLGAGVLALYLERDGPGLPGAALVLVGLTLYTTFQAVPLPRALVARLAPRNLEVWDYAYDLLKEDRLGWVPLSIDPRATWVEALKWLVYAAAFLAAARAGRKFKPGFVPAVIFGSAIVAALTALGHRLASATSLFGIYKPIYVVTSTVAAPLLNLNNFAGYLNLGAFAGLGLLVARDSLVPRWVIALCVALVVGVSVTSVSRGGFSSLLLGVVILLLLLRRRRFEDKRRQRLLLGMQLGAVLLGLVFFALSTTATAWKLLVQESLHKVDVISWTKPLIAKHFWFGVGRGAFETAFPAYRSEGGGYVYHMAENFLAQWCSEWGVPVGLIAFGSLCWTLRPARLGVRRSTLALGCALGVATLLLQNLVDLALEIPSVSIALFVLLGGLYGAAQQQPEPDAEPVRERRDHRFAPYVLGSAGLGLLTLVALVGLWTAERDRRHVATRLSSAKSADQAANQAVLTRTNEAIRRHPGDPYLPLAASVAARRIGQNPLPWIRGAIERDPASGRPYLVLANELGRRGARDQALLGLRLALERDVGLSPTAAKLALALGSDLDKLREVAPKGTAGAAFLAYAASGVGASENWQLRAALLDEALTRDPTHRSAINARLSDLLARTEARLEPCTEEQAKLCRDRMERLIAQASRANPQSPLPVLARARLLIFDERIDDAHKLLADRCPEFGAAAGDCARLWFTTSVRRNDPNAIEQATAIYLGIACAVPASCARAALWLGDQYEARGQWGTALRMYERAAHESDNPAVWNRVVRSATRAGMYSVAQRAIQRLRQAGQRPDARLLKEVEDARVNQLNRQPKP